MDAEQFDTLARSLTESRSRRGALGSLLLGTLGLLGVRSQDAAAHNPLEKCKNKSGDAKKTCKKKAKKHNAQHAAEVPPGPPPPQCTVTSDCPELLVCLNASCVCLDDTHCPRTQVCARQTCITPVCMTSADCPEACECARDVEGTAKCFHSVSGNCLVDCTSDTGCSAGRVCARGTCGQDRVTCSTLCPG